MSAVTRIIDVKQYTSFKEGHRKGVIFYGAKWCQACKEINALYEAIGKRYHKRIALGYVDIDECGLDFTTVPVFVAFHEGCQVDSMEGVNAETLKAFIKAAVLCERELLEEQTF